MAEGFGHGLSGFSGRRSDRTQIERIEQIWTDFFPDEIHDPLFLHPENPANLCPILRRVDPARSGVL
jgi:hypothetical protein